MIKIRYRDPHELAPGLYAAAERHGRRTTVYLLPGLSVAQRRAALRRLRISARRGCGPRLPAPQLALALLADRVRTTAGRAGAVFRSHPAGSTVPVMVVSAGAIAFLALSAVSIRVIQPPRDSSQPSFAGAPRPVSRRVRASGPRRSRVRRTGSGGQLPGRLAARRARRRRDRVRAPARTPADSQNPETGLPVTGRPWPGAPTRRPRRARRRPAPAPGAGSSSSAAARTGRARPAPPVPRPRRARPRAGCA